MSGTAVEKKTHNTSKLNTYYFMCISYFNVF